jgi:hypothetical protein
MKDALFIVLVKHIRYLVRLLSLLNQHLLKSGALSRDSRCNVFPALRS